MDYIKGLVSVVIPTFKRSETLARAVKSVLNQSYNNIEVLVVNDNVSRSDEFSLELKRILQTMNDERVILVEQERHINGAAARNAGIRESKGEFIAFLDDDDTWETSKISKQVDALNNLDETWGGVSCLSRKYKNGKLLKCGLPYKSGYLLTDILERRFEMGIGALLIRREALDNCGYFDEELQRHQDLQLFAFFSSKYKILLIKEYLYNIEVSDSQNRPNAEKLINIKRLYFSKISPVMATLSEKQQKIIFALHDFEVSYVYFKEHKYCMALRKGRNLICSPIAIKLAIERIIRRLIEKECRFSLEKKYSGRDKEFKMDK